MLSDKSSLLASRMLPLWFGLVLVAVVPFLSILRVGPLSSFFLESGSLLFVLVFVLLSAFSGSLNSKIPFSSYYFVVLAIFWALQARVMHLTYVGLSDIVAWTFVVLALACWACRGWINRIGTERVLSVLAWVLLVGSLLNAFIGWLQFTGIARHMHGWLMYRPGIVEGQLAQRNHFAHYLMWGVLSAAWLWAQHYLRGIYAAACVLFLAAIMGLTGSRTVLGYVLAIMVLLPVYHLFSGSHDKRTLWALGWAVACVLVCQLAAEPVLHLFQNNSITSAVERLNGAQLEGSGRGYEWRKAWQIFLSAPFLGYGWGSYPLQGFLTDVYPTHFRPYEGSVLFTHSHNSLLNLLAEMGLVGTILVLGGLAWSVRGCFQRRNSPAGVLILAWLSVLLVHSFLEYPLWYIYFLSVFGLFIGFAPTTSQREQETYFSGSLNAWRHITAIIVSTLLITSIVRLGFVYQQLRQFSGSTRVGIIQRTQNIVGLLRIARTEPMLRYYAQLQLTNYIDPSSAHLPDWATDTTREAMTFRPFANAHKYAFSAYRSGDIQAARQWMRYLYRYYPTKMPAYASHIMNTDYYPQLRNDYTTACHTYFTSIKRTPNCAQSLYDLPHFRSPFDTSSPSFSGSLKM